jgi:hypothetical protein
VQKQAFYCNHLPVILGVICHILSPGETGTHNNMALCVLPSLILVKSAQMPSQSWCLCNVAACLDSTVYGSLDIKAGFE